MKKTHKDGHTEVSISFQKRSRHQHTNKQLSSIEIQINFHSWTSRSGELRGDAMRPHVCVPNKFILLAVRPLCDWQLGQVFNLNTIYRFTLLYGDLASRAVQVQFNWGSIDQECSSTLRNVHRQCTTTDNSDVATKIYFYDRHRSDFWCKTTGVKQHSSWQESPLCLIFSSSHCNGFMINSMVVYWMT